MTDNTGEKKRTDALANRAHLLEVAQAVFAESGLDLEVNDVAARAQLGVGTLYRHFGNREGLLRALLSDIVDDTLAQMRLAVQSSKEDPRAALQALISSGLQVEQQYRSFFDMLRDPRLRKLMAPREDIATEFLGLIKGIIEGGIEAGVFRDDLDLDLISITIIGALSFTTLFDGMIKRESLVKRDEQLFDLLWSILTARN